MSRRSSTSTCASSVDDAATFVISGGGIAGLVLALAIKKHLGITPEIYEKAKGFAEDVGAGLGVYPNGLRVLRDIDPELLNAVRNAGYPYLYRIWEKHDGTRVAKAKEDVLAGGEEELMSIGIKRWKLQDVLYAAVAKERIPIHFRKATENVIEHLDGLVEVQFADGTSRMTKVLFGVDGAHSTVRQCVVSPTVELEYTGVTCLMGMAKTSMQQRGIHFPSSVTSNYHAVYFPVGKDEQCFQIHFPVKEEDSDRTEWGNLAQADGKVQFEKLAEEMEQDGWAREFTDPLYQVDHSVRVGFALMKNRLQRWVYGENRRIILVGDAAHPPVPYVGQGAQMGIEDAGTLVLLIKALCFDEAQRKLHLSQLGRATAIYEKLRIPRTSKILDCSKNLGDLQARRSEDQFSEMEDLMLKGEVMMNDTLIEMLPGATYNYSEEVKYALRKEQRRRRSKTIKPRSSCSSLSSKVTVDEAMDALWGGANPFVS